MSQKNLVQFKIQGLNLARLLNFLILQGIVLYDVERQDLENVKLSIRKGDRKKFNKYVDKKKFKVVEIKNSRIERTLKFFLQNIYFFISGIICVCACFVLNLFVFQKQINGASVQLTNDIEKIFSDKKIKEISLKSKIDVLKLENEIKEKLENVSLCSINFKGLTLIINVKERDEQAGIIKRENIVATQSGFVSSVNLISGTLAVKAGDFVEKGDLLIKGETFLNGEIKRVNPIGEIKLTAHYTANLIFNENQEILIRSGRKNVEKYWTLWGNKVKLKQEKEKKLEFSLYEKEVIKTSNNLFMIVPIKSFEEITYELEIKKIFVEFEKEKQNLLDKVILQAKTECEFFGELISQSTECIMLSKNVYLLKGNIQFSTICN